MPKYDARRIEQIARDVNLRCRDCLSSELKSEGVIQRYKGDVRVTLYCTNQTDKHPNWHMVEFDMKPDKARQIGLPVPPFRKSAPRRPPGGTAPYA
jgi:hypothetical protein